MSPAPNRPVAWPALVNLIQRITTWITATRAMRAFTRFLQANGPTLCGGIAYTALFSVFGALAIGYTFFARMLGNNQQLLDSLLETIDDFIPGLLSLNGKPGLIAPEQLIQSTGLTATSIIAGVILLWAALGAMSAIRRSTRAMFDLPVKQSNMALAKLRELAGLTILGLSVLTVTVASIAVTGAGQWFMSAFRLPRFAGWAIPLGIILVSFIIDALVYLLVVRVLAGVKLPRRDRLWGAGLAGVGFGILRQSGTALVASSASSASSNFLVASLTVVITLLLWANLSATIYLLSCAFAANPSLVELDQATPIPGQPAPTGYEVGQIEAHTRQPGLLTRVVLIVGAYGLGWRYGARRQRRKAQAQVSE